MLDHQGILVRVSPLDDSNQVIVPESLRPRLLANGYYAAVSGHPGGRRMYETMRKKFYWPSMSMDVYTTVLQCDKCARNRVVFRKHANNLKLFPPRGPLENTIIDILGPLPRTTTGNRFVVVMTDRFSKLCRFRALRTITAEKLARTFAEEWVFVYGPPQSLLSDNGPQFTAKLFREACRLMGVRNVYTSTYHPQTNGLVERMKRTLVGMLQNYVADHQRVWDYYLPALDFAYNRCVHRTTQTTPFDLVLSRPPPALGAEHLTASPELKPRFFQDRVPEKAKRRHREGEEIIVQNASAI